jgi:hypothetical protein
MFLSLVQYEMWFPANEFRSFLLVHPRWYMQQHQRVCAQSAVAGTFMKTTRSVLTMRNPCRGLMMVRCQDTPEGRTLAGVINVSFPLE